MGIYMAMAFMAYIVAWGILKNKKKSECIQVVVYCLATILGTAIGILFLVQPKAVASVQFWHNAFEHVSLFVQGWGALPITDGLKDKQFFAFVVGFIIPVVYVTTLIYQSTLVILRKIDFENIFSAMLCVYGLGLYHYFIHRSGVTSYYAVCIPLVLVICFWICSPDRVLALSVFY